MAHPDIDKVAFTGSTEFGKLIVQAGRQPEEGIAGTGRQVAGGRLSRRRPRTALPERPTPPRYGLAASIETRDIGIAHKLTRKLKAGSVWINTHNFNEIALSSGGYKQCGWAAKWAVRPSSCMLKRPSPCCCNGGRRDRPA